MSRRRMRTQAEWKVEAQTPSASGPSRADPRRLVGEGDGQDLPGPGRVHGAKPLRPVEVQGGGVLREALQEGQVLLRGLRGDEVGVAAPAVGQEGVDPLDEDGGLAAARPGQEEEGPLGGHGGFSLHGVQPAEVPGDDVPPGGDVALVEVVHSVTSFLGRRSVQSRSF